ncbi:B-cell lymphoma 3 protein homolog [Saccoglossus kowalevskii]|uniref:Ankyrin repeat domain-containing protein 18B-like n=1 Tax=Saccoglossus kowalevskii TaxID=10224 RepID=A0ABM0LYP4_SACKO|nr:PREDICTED: ankyrin repeat domain-containing protein 18B-like [Saccoglossus kowalevskii]
MAGRLFDAVTGTRFAEVKLLLDLHVNVDCKNILGQTPLFVTLQIDDEGKRDKMFRYLVRRGAEVLEEDYRQKTLFQYTCELGRVKQATRILDQVGAGSVNLNGRDLDGNTALLYAVKSKNIEIVKMLVEMLRFYHMTVDLVDNDGCTPLIHAKKLGLSEISDILLRDGRANAHIADNISRFNAYEWEEHTKERLKREARDEKEKQKVQNLIFPKVGQVQAKKKQILDLMV